MSKRGRWRCLHNTPTLAHARDRRPLVPAAVGRRERECELSLLTCEVSRVRPSPAVTVLAVTGELRAITTTAAATM